MGAFTRADVTAATGITRGAMDQLLAHDVVRASVAETTGSGVHRLFSLEDMITIAIGWQLLKASIPVRVVKNLLPTIDALRRGGTEAATLTVSDLGDGRREWRLEYGDRADAPESEILLHLDRIAARVTAWAEPRAIA